MPTLLRALAAACLLAAATHSHAAFRAYLSVSGTDNPNCSLGAPCRLMSAAMAAVNDGGEIWMMDSGNFNLVTVDVTKSVSIDSVPGAIGSILAINGPAFRVNTASVNLVLRNIVIKKLAGSGSTSGVEALSATSVIVDRCIISDLPQYGIDVSGPMFLQVTDTTIRGSLNAGVRLTDGPTASLTRVSIVRNLYGIEVVSTASSTPTAVSNGILVLGTATTLVVSDNTITGNASYGIFNDDGVVESAGSNVVRQNGTNSSGTISPIGKL